MNELELTWPKLALAMMAAGGGLVGAIVLPQVWPYVFDGGLWAIRFNGLSLAALVLATGAQGGWKTTLILGAIVLALAGTGTGFLEPGELVAMAFGAMRDWHQAGFAPLRALNAGLDVFRNLTPAQVSAYQTGLVMGALPLAALIASAVIFIFRVRDDRAARRGPWRAAWMDAASIRYLRTRITGLPLGLKDGGLLRYAPDPRKNWRAGHHAAIAGTRAGKGVSVVIPAIVDHDGPVVVLDVKGENFAVTRRWRQSLGRRVVVLNPFGLIEPAHDGFNPLDSIRPAHLVRDIDVIAEGLVRPESGAGAHFAELARGMVAAVIEVVVTCEEISARNLNRVVDIMFAGDFEDRLKDWVDNPQIYGRRPAQAAATFLAASDKERGGVRTTLKRAFDWARSDDMRAFLAKSSAELDDLLDDKIDLFIAVPLDQVDAQSVFMRLMINLVLATVVRQDGHRKAKEKILLVLDEFVRLGRMEKLLNIANVAAGAGIEALFITQDKGQIEGVYGKGDTASLIGSCVTIRIFGLGRAESYTADWAAAALGDRTVLTRSRQAPATLGDKVTISTAEQRQKLMTADEILEMPANEMLCLIGSKAPLRLKAIVSHKHPAYRHKLDPNPTLRA